LFCEEVIALQFGHEDSFIWLLLLVFAFTTLFGKKESPEVNKDTCANKEEPVYIYRNPKRNKPRRRLVY
jgi:hypothetical protein